MAGKVIGQIKVTDVIDNPDGTATIYFDVSEEIKNQIKETMGWERWSDKKFNELVINSLDYYAEYIKQTKSEEKTQS